MSRPPLRAMLLLVALSVARSSGAQARAEEPLPRWAVSTYVAISSPTRAPGYWIETPRRSQYMLGMHFVAPVLRAGPLRLDYALDAIPAFLMTNSPDRNLSLRSAFGAGIAPLGLELQLGGATAAWRLFATGSVGGLWFTREVPIPRARAFNYTYEYGGGMVLYIAGATGVRIGYKFHHLSNLYTAPRNPGLDGKFLYLGVEHDFARSAR